MLPVSLWTHHVKERTCPRCYLRVGLVRYLQSREVAYLDSACILRLCHCQDQVKTDERFEDFWHLQFTTFYLNTEQFDKVTAVDLFSFIKLVSVSGLHLALGRL